MGENHMADVAKILGVELDEEFIINGKSSNPYKITTDGLTDGSGFINKAMFVDLMAGNLEIIKEKRKPSTGDNYYYIEATLDCNHIDVWQEIWKDTTEDMERYALGNFFKTREEASSSVNAYCKYLNNVVADLSWHNNK